MSEINVTSNYRPREIIDAWELDQSERDQFDYLDWQAIDRGEDSASFVRYRGELHDLGEFMITSELNPGSGHFPLQWWDGYRPDSFFDGLVIKLADSLGTKGHDPSTYGEYAIIGHYFA